MLDLRRKGSTHTASYGQEQDVTRSGSDRANAIASLKRQVYGPGTSEIQALVLRYRPRSLGARKWSLARASAAQAVVRSKPSSLKEVKQIACDLCALLASVPFDDWDRRSVPDLPSLVTASRINSFTSVEGMPGAAGGFRARRRTRLKRLTQALSGIGTLRTGRLLDP